MPEIEEGQEVLEELEVEASEEEQSEPDAVDSLAAELGWRPKSEWQGEEGAWIDSREFLKKGRELIRSQSREIKDVKKQLEGISRATSAMVERGRQEERERLEALYDRAVDDGDVQESRKVRAKIDSLERTAPSLPQEGQEFAEKHSSWFGKDTEATDYAIRRSSHYADQGLSPARQLAAVEREMKENFPELFPQAPKPQPTMGRPQRQVSQPREKGYGSLPAAARAACDQFVREQQEMGNTWATKETWVQSYFSQEASNG